MRSFSIPAFVFTGNRVVASRRPAVLVRASMDDLIEFYAAGVKR
jgi:hypothetical protein